MTGNETFTEQAAQGSAGDTTPLFPFLISYDGPDNASSMAHLLDAPAGRHGFLRVEGGRLVHDAGAIRLNAVNLTGPANFPTQPEADKLAARLARFGINCVRLHYMDESYGNFMTAALPGIVADDPATRRHLVPRQVDRLDYLIAALKQRGIYVNMNLHVHRQWDERDGFTGKDRRPPADKGLDNFEPRMIELQKEYARKLLTHVNPYTGLACTDDPCVAMVEINNENGLIDQYHCGGIDRLPDPYAAEFRRQWNVWLRRKYGDTGMATVCDPEIRLADGTLPTIRNDDNTVPLQLRRDFYQFLVDTERAYWTGMYRFLKDELKARPVISGTQIEYSPAHVQADLDYIDSHEYWNCPDPVSPEWRMPHWALVNYGLASIQAVAGRRVLGKPYTVSEYNHPFPHPYGAEAQPLLRAYGALQGWDGVFAYTYNPAPYFEPNRTTYFFSILARTDVLAHFPACAAMYLRGDVREARQTVIGAAGYGTWFDRLVDTRKAGTSIAAAGLDGRVALIHKTAVDLSGKAGTDPETATKKLGSPSVLTSDTGELTWNHEVPGAAYWTVDTPNTKLFSGFPKGRTISLGGVRLTIGRTQLEWATVSLVSRNATGFGEAGRPASILLAATGVSENCGMRLEREKEGRGWFTLTDWGQGPTVVEGVTVTILLPADPARMTCYALDSAGKRRQEVPVAKSPDGGARIEIGPEYETVWYEIELQ